MEQKPDYTFNFDDADSGAAKSGTDASVNELTRKVLSATKPAPVIDSFPDTYVKLPAGLLLDDEIHQDAEVRELTGEDEEKIAKARATNNAAKFISTLLNSGVVAIGGNMVNQKMLDSLLQGDLDMLLLGIRKATFGDDFKIYGVACPTCGERSDLTLNLNDIPIARLDDPSKRVFKVKLRKGRAVTVQFPYGAIQTEIFKTQLTVSEMNNITLSHCVLSFIEADGSERPSNGISDVKKLGIADRNTIQDYLYEEQPGPRYDKVVAECPTCEGEVPVPLNVGILFREL